MYLQVTGINTKNNIKQVTFLIIIINRDAAAQACDCKRDREWDRFPLEEIKYFIFLFPRSSNENTLDVEFRHSIRNAC